MYLAGITYVTSKDILPIVYASSQKQENLLEKIVYYSSLATLGMEAVAAVASLSLIGFGAWRLYRAISPSKSPVR